MNKIRRKSLQSIIDQLEELKGSLEDLQAEEEAYRDNIPENMHRFFQFQIQKAASRLTPRKNGSPICLKTSDKHSVQKEKSGEFFPAFFNFKYKGGKPFDTTQKWFTDLIKDIGQA